MLIRALVAYTRQLFVVNFLSEREAACLQVVQPVSLIRVVPRDNSSRPFVDVEVVFFAFLSTN